MLLELKADTQFKPEGSRYFGVKFCYCRARLSHREFGVLIRQWEVSAFTRS